jgi:hypothetical protein
MLYNIPTGPINTLDGSGSVGTIFLRVNNNEEAQSVAVTSAIITATNFKKIAIDGMIREHQNLNFFFFFFLLQYKKNQVTMAWNDLVAELKFFITFLEKV